MVYLDNAATTLIKPQSVYDSVYYAMRNFAGAGRSGHGPSTLAGNTIYDCREEVASFFGMKDVDGVIFTKNATEALNIAIKSIAKDNDVALITGFEHNSVVRPLVGMDSRGISIKVAGRDLFNKEAVLEDFRKMCDEGINFAVINYVSNVFGFIQPVKEIDEILHSKNIPMILDASQAAGVLDIDVSTFKSVAAVAMPGHKALMGPQGTGILLILDNSLINKSLIDGGTGSSSMDFRQPDIFPDKFESGTQNSVAIAGLREGILFLKNYGLGRIREKEQHLLSILIEYLENVEGTQVFYDKTYLGQSGVLSFISDKINSELLSEELWKYGICVRAGLHCAPMAHQSAGTYETGTVRIGLSVFNTIKDIRTFISAYTKICARQLK